MSTIRHDYRTLSSPESPLAAACRGAAALALLMLSVLPASAQQLQANAATQPAYIIHRSHVEWKSTAARVADPSRTAYHIYSSHIGWDADARPEFPRGKCYDWCSGAAGMEPVATYSWDDVVHFFTGR
jgi:hypothetical protein